MKWLNTIKPMDNEDGCWDYSCDSRDYNNSHYYCLVYHCGGHSCSNYGCNAYLN